jgi:hypothetical protein
MEFNDLLHKAGVEPASVLIMRHRPSDPLLRKALRRLALEDEQSFIDYQSSHGPRTEAALRRVSYIASFVADGSNRALFVGLFAIRNSEVVEGSRWLENPTLRALVDLEVRERRERPHVMWFSQERVMSFYPQWTGCLCVTWPPPERAWFRRAERNTLPVISIHEEQALVPRLADWDQLVFGWKDLADLPRRHSDLLESWRGIYLIKDLEDGLCYVGSAYGQDNLLGRWLSYGRSGHGGNALLRGRTADSFQFSILERLAETADPRLVIARENSWKMRLGTRAPHGLNAN